MWPEVLDIDWGGWIVAVLLVYSAASFGAQIAIGMLASDEVGRQRRRLALSNPLHLFGSDQAPPVSVLLPARHDEKTIVDSVRAIMELDYPALEIVVANDASRDGTLDRLIREFGLKESMRTPRSAVPGGSVRAVYGSPRHPALTVIDLARGGSRARAANFALAYARYPLVLVTDADTVLERETLVRLALPFYEDATVAAAIGIVRPANGTILERGSVTFCGRPASRLARFQVVESLRGALGGQLAWGSLDSLFLVPRTLGLYSRDAIAGAGGFRVGNVGDDVDLCMRLHRRAAQGRQRFVVRCVNGAIAWTRVPERLRQLARQRARLYQAMAEGLWFNRELLFNGRLAIRQGMTWLHHLFFELIGPVVETAGQIALVVLLVRGDLDLMLFVIYLSVYLVGGTVPSLMAFALERGACPRFQRASDLESLALAALFENIGYRQMTAWWRLVGLWRALWGRKLWGEKGRRARAEREAKPEAKEAA